MLFGNDTILEVDAVSKIFARSRTVTRQRLARTLSRVLFGRSFDQTSGKLQKGEFYAVKDIGFSLRRGEALGIIGLNGSGKTTLLRMLAGQILPDSGQITVLGKTASMIDLTAGFQPHASGRENIFLRGAALGRSRVDMEKAYDGIAEFSELGDAISAPVATYSSGMTMRLAFSIVAAAAPDILFIDEVLAVGDFKFRQKCLARIRELREHSAFVMVSHSMADVRRFCDKVIVMNKGVAVFKGNSEEAVDYYTSKIENPQESENSPKKISRIIGPFFENEDALSDVRTYWSDSNGNEVSEAFQDSEVFLNVSFTCSVNTRNLNIGIPVWSQDGIYMTGFSTEQGFGAIKPDREGRVLVRLAIPSLHFNAGVYHSNLTVIDGTEFLWRRPNPPLAVLQKVNPHWGAVTIPSRWEYV